MSFTSQHFLASICLTPICVCFLQMVQRFKIKGCVNFWLMLIFFNVAFRLKMKLWCVHLCLWVFCIQMLTSAKHNFSFIFLAINVRHLSLFVGWQIYCLPPKNLQVQPNVSYYLFSQTMYILVQINYVSYQSNMICAIKWLHMRKYLSWGLKNNLSFSLANINQIGL